jgi:uracil-DNA glycosylase
MKSKFLQNIIVHPDWEGFLTNEIQKNILEIEKEVSKSDYTPTPEKVLRFLSVPLSSVKIIILGQDPYPQAGVATGRAFEVGNLRSWAEPFRNISIKNILRAIYKAYTGEIIKYNQLKAKFDNEFPVLPPGKLFGSWEVQGVLLLNTSFTCELGKPGSHKKIWEEFSNQLFCWINNYHEDITWFLWGVHALEAATELNLKNSIKTQHPMMCFEGKGRKTDFLFGGINCFDLYKDQINWTGYTSSENVLSNPKLF